MGRLHGRDGTPPVPVYEHNTAGAQEAGNGQGSEGHAVSRSCQLLATCSTTAFLALARCATADQRQTVTRPRLLKFRAGPPSGLPAGPAWAAP